MHRPYCYKAASAVSMLTDPFRAADTRLANYLPNTVKFLLFHQEGYDLAITMSAGLFFATLL